MKNIPITAVYLSVSLSLVYFMYYQIRPTPRKRLTFHSRVCPTDYSIYMYNIPKHNNAHTHTRTRTHSRCTATL